MTTRAAIFLDFDNVFSTLWDLDWQAAVRFASDPSEWLETLANTHLSAGQRRWLVARCYLNPSGYVLDPSRQNERYYFSKFRPGFVRAGFEVVDCPVFTRAGKNAADIRIVIDALDLLNHRTRFEEIVLASGDSDFTPLLQRLRADDRLITILSPGYHSSAYSSLADKLLGFDDLEALLRGQPEAAEATPTTLADSESMGAAETFAQFIKKRYEEAAQPLNLAGLAGEVARTHPETKVDNWLGYGTFSAAVKALQLPRVRLSNHYMWDEERHQPPIEKGDPSGLPGPIAMLMPALELPRLPRETWPKVFEALADYAASHEFNLIDAIGWARATLAEAGMQVSRNALSYVIRGTYFGGVQLDAANSPTAADVGQAFCDALLDRASADGVPLDADTERALFEWLGLESLVP